MESKIKDLDFSQIDYKKYKSKIDIIKVMVKRLEKDKSLMKKLKRFVERKINK